MSSPQRIIQQQQPLLLGVVEESPPLQYHASKMETCFRFCDERSLLLTGALVGLALLMFHAVGTWCQSDVTVTIKLASLAMMVAMCIPLTYLPLAELHAHVQLQRRGSVRQATVVNHIVNAAGFARWQVEIMVPQGILRKWVHCSTKLVLGSVVDVKVTDNWIYCRVENTTRPIWRTTLYLATLIFVSLTDTIESLYFVLFGIIEAVNLLRQEGCGLANIGLHLLFAVVFGAAICAISHCCFWKRRYADLPSIYEYEFIMPSRHQYHRRCCFKNKNEKDDEDHDATGKSSLIAYAQIV